jgi:hypothetical protein
MNQYTSYITSEHQKPNFLAIVSGLTQPFDDIEQLSLDLNINTTTDYMLDILGRWIGQSRVMQVPIQLLPVEWDILLYGGWDTGVWYDDFASVITISTLDDSDYRFLLILKIAQNNFDGTAATAYKILNLFGAPATITDNQDMTCVVNFLGSLNLIQEALISQNLVNLAPFGVSIQYT